MNTPLLVWTIIAVLALLVFVVRLINTESHPLPRHHAVRVPHHFIEMGSEREEFYLPGDPCKEDADYYED